MKYRFPGLELREPLRSHPFAGALYGGILGALFGALAPRADFAVGGQWVFYGYLIGGLAGGLLIGVGIPLFRSRFLAGVVVGGAASLGLAIASWFWNEPWGPEGVLFLGVMCGFIYAALLWDYRGDKSVT